MSTIQEPAAVDVDKLMAFVFRAVDEVGATLNAALVVMGDRLGLYKAMAGAGPLTPAELAQSTGTAERYVREFDQKWLRGGAPADEPLVGSADLQSLADLGNSFEIVKGMKPVPFGKDTLLQLAVISLAPVAPLVLTMIPLGELLDRFLHVVF